MNYMTLDGIGVRWGWLSKRALSTHSMYDLSLARHVHGAVWHVHWNAHGGTMLSRGLRFWLPAFIRV